jgi:uncharacterized membrane protein YkoI
MPTAYAPELQVTVHVNRPSRSRRRALKITGGGKANAVERDSEKGATYEVEVRKPDGATVDVRLDAGYGLVVVDADSEQADAGN